MPVLRFKDQLRWRVITPEKIKAYQPTLLFWGTGGAVAVALFFQSIPIFQADVLKKVPVISSYYQDKVPDSDKPF